IVMRIDITRHGAREHLARRCHRPNGQRPLDPGADEAHLVVNPNAALALELPDLIFDFLFDFLADIVAPLLEQPDVPPDVALDDSLLQLEEPQLPLDPLFESTQGRKRHGKSHTTKHRPFKTFTA